MKKSDEALALHTTSESSLYNEDLLIHPAGESAGDTSYEQVPFMEEVLSLTEKLMKVPSIAENTEGLKEVLAIAGAQLTDFTLETFESNDKPSLLVHNAAPGTRHFTIILNAHLDVMQGSAKEFTTFIKDGKLHGRGGYDMKAAAGVMIHVFKHLAKTISYPLALQIVTDEEIGGFDGTAHQIKEGLRGDFVISGDCGSNLTIINQAKGILWLKLHATGTPAHGAYVWRGENALWKLQQALHILQQAYPVPKDASWETTMNLAKIETANESFNQVPDNATAYLDFRFIEQDKQEIIEKIQKLLPDGVTMDIEFANSPEFVAEDNPYVQKLADALASITQKDELFSDAHAPSDIRHYNDAGCVGVQFGPIGEHQHSDDEWLDLESLESYARILQTYLLSVDPKK